MEKQALICSRVEDQSNPVTGATRSNCEECDVLIWISPSTASVMLDHGEMMLLCTTCGFKHVEEAKKAGEIIKIGKPNRDQIEEIKQELKKGEHDQTNTYDRGK